MASVDRGKPRASAPARTLFGTDGIRGTANVDPVTCETAVRLGRALVQCCGRQQRPHIVVGKDTRLSGDMLESALVAGICSAGADALLTGVLPTPGVAYLTRALKADAGVVVSASHNPFADNGLKLFASTGYKLPDDVEAEIEQVMRDTGGERRRPVAAAVGRIAPVAQPATQYADFLHRTLPERCHFGGLKVVIDCAHGAASAIGPQIFSRLGASVSAIGAAPDGTNINDGVGAMHPQRLQDAVLAQHAALGVALDGDADRLLCVDETGTLVDGDEILAIIAADMISRGTLRHATVVATVMSNIGLEVSLQERGARLVRVQVGDRYVVDEMVRGDCNLGGEQSGHLLLLDHTTTGDGLVAGLAVARLMTEQQRPLSVLKTVIRKFPQVLLNVPMARRTELDTVVPVQEEVARVQQALDGRGRVLVRASGTEPAVRVMVEGDDEARIRSYAEEIAAAIRRHVGN